MASSVLLLLASLALVVAGLLLPAAWSGNARAARAFSVLPPDPPPLTMLPATLEAAERVLDFFKRDYSATNVDGLFGLRIGQGQIQAALALCASGKQCDPSLTSRLKALDRGVEETVQRALPYVKVANRPYYLHFRGWLEKPFQFPYTPTSVGDVSDITSLGPLQNMLGLLSDECMARASGTFFDVQLNRPVEKCNISDTCWNYMTGPGASSYRITHDLLYFLNLEINGCQQNVAAYVGHDFDFRLTRDELCRRIYVEANVISTPVISPMSRDLLMEQVAFCGLLGYEDFLQQRWLRAMLSWQDREGCFKAPMGVRSIADILHAFADRLKSERKTTVRGTGRRLLTEQMMTDGCLAHLSTLGFSTFSTFLHYFATQLPDSPTA